VEIRKIQKAETETALQLIWKTFLQFEAPDYSQQGVDNFYKFISDQEIIAQLEFFGAFEDNLLKGVIATRENRKHICCFFVSATYQKQGIGRQLWEHLKNITNHTELTVNSSPFAVPIYHKLGFVDVDTEQISDGIRYTPMKYIRK
jgi:GNAT superfamily N-acetyltransferase